MSWFFVPSTASIGSLVFLGNSNQGVSGYRIITTTSKTDTKYVFRNMTGSTIRVNQTPPFTIPRDVWFCIWITRQPVATSGEIDYVFGLDGQHVNYSYTTRGQWDAATTYDQRHTIMGGSQPNAGQALPAGCRFGGFVFWNRNLSVTSIQSIRSGLSARYP